GGNSTGGSGNNASLTGNISIEGQSRISKILIDGSNMGGSGTNGTPKLDGNITMDGTSAIANGITIANGGTLDGNINAQNSSSIGGIAINNGSLAGNISLTNNARIQNGIVLDNSANMTGDISMKGDSRIDSIAIDGTLEGNVSAAWGDGGNGTINQMDISGVITQKVQLDNNSKIATLNLNGGTITGGINFQGLTTNSNNDTATIDNLTLNNDAYIGGIDIGNTSGGNAEGVISNLTLNNAASIGSIVNNRGTISELILNNASTITNGITNAVEGNIGTITSNTNNINNTITNSGTINELVVSKGTITYIDNSNSGVVDSLLQVEDGATLKMGSSGNGTITIGSDLGSVLDLKQGSTFEGNLKNASVIKEWKNVSNIDGSFINDTGASVVDLTAGQISQNLLNEGNITNLTIDKTIGGALINDNGGVINTLIIQDSSVITSGITNNASSTITTLTINDGANVTGGITNDSNIGSLNLQENVTYDGSGSITNALDIAGTKTLTATNNGINILFANGATGTINNEGIIDGSLTNTASSTIKTFNTGSISGSITNNATIQELNVTGNVTNGITNDSTITTLTNNQANTNITNKQNIGTLDINANTTYAGAGSITNALNVTGNTTQFTINSNGTLTLTDTAGANSVKTIT
ncbi:beta strand repeat-containing protein, partial [Helicobacter pullorum]|uniref:beta strand repeat-containing protein n=1 Tax=Helicobacter pullorum TaxID=35818 RepID=UPI000AE074AD